MALTPNREGLPVSLCLSGLHTPCRAYLVTIDVSPTHPLIQLAQVIAWPALAELVLPDLKRTTAKGQWWRGRKLKLRVHLAAFLLQWLYDLTDREVEWAIKDNAAYQLFCGCCIVEDWHAPDHTKIEAFRSRLSPETQRQIANQVAVWATKLGFADPSKMDQRAHLNRNLRFHPARAVSRPRPLVSSSTDDEQNLLLAFFPTVCDEKNQPYSSPHDDY